MIFVDEKEENIPDESANRSSEFKLESVQSSSIYKGHFPEKSTSRKGKTLWLHLPALLLILLVLVSSWLASPAGTIPMVMSKKSLHRAMFFDPTSDYFRAETHRDPSENLDSQSQENPELELLSPDSNISRARARAGSATKSESSLSSDLDPKTSYQVHGPKPLGFWLARGAFQPEKAQDIYILGSSQLGGLRTADARKANCKLDYVLDYRSLSLESSLAKSGGLDKSTYIAAIPGGITADYCALARALVNAERVPELVIFCLSPRDFFPPRAKASLAESSIFRYFAPDAQFSREFLGRAYPTAAARLAYLLTDAPIARYLISSSSSGQDNNDQHFLDKLEPGMLYFDPADMREYRTLTVRYPDLTNAANLRWYEEQMAVLENTINKLQENSVPVLLVDMPLRLSNRSQLPTEFWERYHRRLESICQNQGSMLLELSHNNDFEREDFLDSLHLSGSGGDRLASQISDFLLESKKY